MSIFLIFYLAVLFIVWLLWSVSFPLWELLVVFFIAGILPPAFLTCFFYKRLDYMESDDLDPPAFSGSKSIQISCRTVSKSRFDEILQRIDRNFIVSFSDRKNHVVKFRTDSRVLSWGVAAYVKMVDENEIEVVVYPMNPNSRKEEKVLLQTLRLLKAVLNP